jgi:ribosome-associated translation inhibitor RaiA
MQVLVNHDNRVRIGEAVSTRLAGVIEASLQRFGDRVTRIELHLTDENAHKGGAADHRCVIEARLANLAPIAVTNRAEAFQVAFEGALEKLQRALEHALGKARRSRDSVPTPSEE